MAVASTTAMHLRANAEIRTVIWQPADAATAQLVDLGQPQGASTPCLPILGFRRFLAQMTISLQQAGANAIVAFSIYAATSAAGAGGVAVVTHALGTTPNAEGDSVTLECTVEQIRETLATATHVGVWCDMTHNDDEVAVTFIRAEPLHARDGLTADYIS
jgi:hypothetical protein